MELEGNAYSEGCWESSLSGRSQPCPQGEGLPQQGERESDTPQIAGPHLNYVTRRRICKFQSVTGGCPTLNQGAHLAGSRWARGCCHCTSEASCHRWPVLVGCAPLPQPQHTYLISMPSSQGLLCCHWPSAGLILATLRDSLALLPWNAELGSTLRDVLTKLD